MKKMFLKIISTVLCVVMVFGSAPLAGFVGLELPEFDFFIPKAEAADNSGTCGNNLTWTIDTSTGTLTITGTGVMTDFEGNSLGISNSPWYTWHKTIKIVIIESGVKNIGSYAFSNCENLSRVTIPDSVTSIGSHSFDSCTKLTNITIPDSVTYIGNSAFYGTAFLKDKGNWENDVLYVDDYLISAKTSISGDYSIKESTKGIASSAFSGCTNLTSIIIPNSVIGIGSSAFYNCSGLTNITIPDSVISIGSSAFYGCASLAMIELSDSVTNIGENAFYNTEYYTNENNWENDVLYIDNYLVKAQTSISGEYSIKESTKGIAGSAFSGCTNLTSIIIPNSVIGIGSSAFYECQYLTNIIIPESVTNIGDYAFYNCKRIKNIEIDNSVTSIGKHAFSGCISLTSATIGDGITNIGDSAFYNCKNLLSIEIPDSVTSIGQYAFYNCTWLTNIEIPDSVTFIGPYAFSECVRLKSITISNCVSGIGDETFAGCSNLTNISLPNGITYIGDCAFYECTKLTNIEIPDSVSSMGDYVFVDCDSLISVTIGNSVSRIGEYAFYNCDRLTSVTIGNSVISIGGYAFYDCSGISSLKIPDSVKRIESLAFAGCGSNKTVYYSGTREQWDKIWIGDNEPLLSWSIVCECDSETPNYCSGSCGENLNYVLNLDGELVITGFGDMTNFTSEDVPWSVCRNKIKSVTFPDEITSIGSYAFYNCTGITEINIPESVTAIGDYAFYNCTGITEINIPESVTAIGDYAFYNCAGITEIEIPEDTTGIGSYAFYNCTGITEINIPENITSIGDYAFYGCSKLKTAYYNGSGDDWKKITVGTDNSCLTDSILYQCNSERPYYTSACGDNITWRLYCDGEFIIEGVGEMTNYIPTSASTTTAPWNNNWLLIKKVTISDGITNVGDYAFHFCSNLESVDLGNSVKTIGENAFDGCEKLKNVFIPDSVTTIGKYAFELCSKLKTITLGNNISSIGKYAFHACNDLTHAYYPGTPDDWNKISVDSNNECLTKIIVFECNSENPYYAKGTCGDGVEWILTPDNELIISGEGNMTDYASASSTPWYNKRALVKEVIIADGVMNISNYAFFDCDNLTSVEMSDDVTTIGDYAFGECSKLTGAYYDGNADKWSSVTIGTGNENLINSAIVFSEYKVIWVYGNKTLNEYVKVGDELIPPDWSGDAGYTFIGWTPEVPDIMPANDLSFTAVYVVNAYDVTFDANGGVWADGSQRKVETVEYDSEIVAPEVPSKAGYIFSGWSYEDKNLGTDLGVMDDVNGKVFKAVWIASTDTVYTVETYTMNAVGEYEKSVQTLNGATDSTVNAEYKVEDGFKLNTEKSVTSGIVSADNSLVLKVYLDRNIYSFATVIDGVFETVDYLYGAIIPEIFPEKTGYSFVGWDKNFPSTMPAEDLIITAEFEANSYDAVFNANSGEWADGSTSKSVATDFDSGIIVPENPVRQGYDFAGWDSEIGIMDDVNGKTFNALWAARNDTKYTVETYIMDVNGKYVVTTEEKQGTTETEISVTADDMEGFTFNSAKSVLDGTIAADGSLVLKICYDRNKYTLTTISDGVSTDTKYYYEAKIETPAALVKTGHTFVEWSGGLPETMPAENIYVEAVWQINTYTVNWVIDGKTTKTEVVYGEAIVTPEAPAKTGYKFVGWTPSIPEKMPADDIAFTAKFEPAIAMSIRNPSTTTISYGDSIILHADMNEALPSGWKIKWTADNGNFSYSVSPDGTTCTISPNKSGDTTFTATVYDESGNEIYKDTQTMKSKAGFFDKFVAFFKKLFGATKVIPQAFNGIF